MARSVIGYVIAGYPPRRRPVYRDEGPARARSGDRGGGDSVARLGAQVVPHRFLVGGDATPGEMDSAGAIERRQATDAQRAAWRAADEGVRTSPLTPRTFTGRASAAQMQASRMRGGEAVKAARAAQRQHPSPVTPSPLEEGSMEAPVTAPPPGRIGAAIAKLPCTGCAHQPVCSIWPTLPRTVIRVDVTLPAAVHLALECDYFLAPVQDDLRAVTDGQPPHRATPVAESAARPETAADAEVYESPDPRLTMRQVEVIGAVRRTAGNQNAAAAALGVDNNTVRESIRRLREQGLLPGDVEALVTARMRAARTVAS